MKTDYRELKRFIVDSNIITEEQFNKALQKSVETDQKIEDVLVSEGLINKIDMSKIKALVLKTPFIDLRRKIVPPEILKIIPEPIARNNSVVAYRKTGKNLEVAMLNPEDLRTIEFIKKKTNLKIIPLLTTPDGIKNILRQYQKTLKAEFGDIISEDDNKKIKSIIEKTGTEREEDLKKIAEELPVIRIVDTLIKHAIIQGASDIHIEPEEKEVTVRYRIDGILRDAMTLPVSVAPGIVARIKILSNLRLDERRLPQDGRFKVETEDYKYSVRVSILPVYDGEKVVMRLLAENTKIFSLESLGFYGENLEKINNNLKKSIGMILVTGPTGSGKTTTLYTVLDILNVPGVNISTIEDPIEYKMPRVNQTQVNSKVGLTFASGFRALVRQDPDIVMVGEIRDGETAKLAINAALTGHLVLSTLHTTNASGTIPRLIDMGTEPFLIASTINIIIAQRLVRKIHGEGAEYNLSEDEIKNLKKYCNTEEILRVLKEEKVVSEEKTFKDITFYRPISSEKSFDGYKGRVGIYEVLNVTEGIKELIMKNANSDQIQLQARKEGMRTMLEDGFIKACKGITSIEEVLRVIVE